LSNVIEQELGASLHNKSLTIKEYHDVLADQISDRQSMQIPKFVPVSYFAAVEIFFVIPISG
jgi:hypothetical protein